MVVKRTAIGKQLRFFFTMFSTNACKSLKIIESLSWFSVDIWFLHQVVGKITIVDGRNEVLHILILSAINFYDMSPFHGKVFLRNSVS